MVNVIDAIINIVKNNQVRLSRTKKSSNRANSMGDALEEYIKDVFSGVSIEDSYESKLLKYNETFSYLGNKNNPPDCILKNGDAIEIKKIESKNTSIALNSSYPKSKIYSDSPMITNDCRHCEDWSVKDLLYIIGLANDDKINTIYMLYGSEYCASKEVYERIKNTIKIGIESLRDVELTETNELAKIKRVDPLGITDLRVRGMWHIKSPFKVFDYIYTPNTNAIFSLIFLVSIDKYNTFDNTELLESMLKDYNNLKIEDKKIKDPNNPANLIDVKLISFFINEFD